MINQVRRAFIAGLEHSKGNAFLWFCVGACMVDCDRVGNVSNN